MFDDHSAVKEFRAQGVDQNDERVANLRWSGDFEEAVAGMCAAAALAKLVNGVVFDEAEDKLLSVDEAIALAKKNIAVLPQPSKERKPRGRTVLKRMLAQLIAKRSDLVLARDLLVICPVRHLIRGAEFQWRDHETRCSAHPYIRPLYQRSTLFLGDAVFEADIDNPDFAPMLLDRLAVEVFEPLGKIATIEDFIDLSWGRGLWTDQLYPSILASRRIEPTRERVARLEAGCEKSLADAKARQAIAKRGRKRHTGAWKGNTLRRISQTRRRYAPSWTAARRRHLRSIGSGRLQWRKSSSSKRPGSRRRFQRSYRRRNVPPTRGFRLTPTPWLEFPNTWRQDRTRPARCDTHGAIGTERGGQVCCIRSRASRPKPIMPISTATYLRSNYPKGSLCSWVTARQKRGKAGAGREIHLVDLRRVRPTPNR